MGYYSRWEGHLSVEPAYIGVIDEDVNGYLEEAEGELVTVVTAEPAIVREFSYTIPVTNYTGIHFSVGERKAYGLREAVENLVNWFNYNTHSTLSGVITVNGEDNTDIWRLKVMDGIVIKEEAILTWPGGELVESTY